MLNDVTSNYSNRKLFYVDKSLFNLQSKLCYSTTYIIIKLVDLID